MKPCFEFVGVGGGLIDPTQVREGDLTSRNTSIILRPDDKHVLMVDLGITNIDVAIREEITHVIITHMHPDHVGGLAHFLLHRKYVQSHLPKPVIIVDASLDLWRDFLRCQLAFDTSVGPDGERVHEIVGLSAFADLHTLWGDSYKIGPLEISFYASRPQKHHIEDMPAFGIIFRVGSEFIVYTADTLCNEGANVLENGRYQARLIFHDLSFKHKPSPADVHAHVTDLIQQVPASLMKKVVAMHYGKGLYLPHRDAFKAVGGLFPTNPQDHAKILSTWQSLLGRS